MSDQLVKTEDIIWRRIGDEVVIMKDDGLSVNVLNKTAAMIWELCSGSKTPDEIAQALCERFEVAFDEAIVDVRETITKLEKMGLLQINTQVSCQ